MAYSARILFAVSPSLFSVGARVRVQTIYGWMLGTLFMLAVYVTTQLLRLPVPARTTRPPVVLRPLLALPSFFLCVIFSSLPVLCCLVVAG